MGFNLVFKGLTDINGKFVSTATPGAVSRTFWIVQAFPTAGAALADQL